VVLAAAGSANLGVGRRGAARVPRGADAPRSRLHLSFRHSVGSTSTARPLLSFPRIFVSPSRTKKLLPCLLRPHLGEKSSFFPRVTITVPAPSLKCLRAVPRRCYEANGNNRAWADHHFEEGFRRI